MKQISFIPILQKELRLRDLNSVCRASRGVDDSAKSRVEVCWGFRVRVLSIQRVANGLRMDRKPSLWEKGQGED